MFFDAYLFKDRVSADLNPARCVPPSIVFMLLTKVNIVEFLYLQGVAHYISNLTDELFSVERTIDDRLGV